jgi:hypothetical protein
MVSHITCSSFQLVCLACMTLFDSHQLSIRWELQINYMGEQNAVHLKV